MHHHLNGGHRYVKQQVRLNHLERFIHHGRRVDSHHRPHVPVGMLERLLHGDILEFRARLPPKCTARCRQDEPPHLAPRAASQGLRQRRMFRVHWHYLIRPLPGRLHQRATGHQGLLVGKRQRAPRTQRGQRRPQPHGSGHAIEHHIGAHGGGSSCGIRARQHLSRNPGIGKQAPQGILRVGTRDGDDSWAEGLCL